MKLFLSILLFLLASPVMAQTEIGEMIWVKGKVQAIDASQKTRTLERRSPILEHDTLVTDTTGSGQIKFTDNSMLVLREGTTIRIDAYKFAPNSPKDDAYTGSLVKGGFRTVTGLISKNNPENYHLKTPVATIGVRGTEYLVFYTPDRGLDVKLDRGAIVIDNKAGSLDLNVEKKRLNAIIKGLNVKPALSTKAAAVFNTQPCFSGAKQNKEGACVMTRQTTPSDSTNGDKGFCIR